MSIVKVSVNIFDLISLNFSNLNKNNPRNHFFSNINNLLCNEVKSHKIKTAYFDRYTALTKRPKQELILKNGVIDHPSKNISKSIRNPISIAGLIQLITVKDSKGARLMSFDDVMDLLDKIESGDFEKTASPEELDRAIELLIQFARKGYEKSDISQKQRLEQDIQELLASDEVDEKFSGVSKAWRQRRLDFPKTNRESFSNK